MQRHEVNSFCTTFVSLLGLIGSFLRSLPLLPAKPGTSKSASADADLILAHALANMAVIKMHSVFASENNAPSKEAAIRAAKAVLMVVKDMDRLRAACVNPIMPVSAPYLCNFLGCVDFFWAP
jgi:hypothetical protein